jgi:hypothetical protein
LPESEVVNLYTYGIVLFFEHSVVALICLCTTSLLTKTTPDRAAMPHVVSSKTLKEKAKEKT